MNYSPEVIRDVERSISRTFGRRFQYQGGAWLWEVGGNMTRVTHADILSAINDELSDTAQAMAARQMRRNARHGAAHISGLTLPGTSGGNPGGERSSAPPAASTAGTTTGAPAPSHHRTSNPYAGLGRFYGATNTAARTYGAGSAVFSAIGGAGAAYGIHASGANLGAGAQAFVSGAGDLTSGAYRAGADVAGAVVAGITAPFGKSGAAVSTLTTAITDTIGGAINGGFGLVSRGARLGGQVVGTGAGLALGLGGAAVGAGIGGAIGGGYGALGGALGGASAGALGGASAGALGGGIGAGRLLGFGAGAVTGAAGGAISGAMIGGAVGIAGGLLVSKIAGDIGEAVGGVLGAGGRIIGGAGQLAATGIRSVTDAVSDLKSETERFARDVVLIRSQSGLSTGRAAGMFNAFNAVGLGGQASALTSPMGNHPMLYGMRSSLFGVPSYENPNFIPALAARFQQSQRGGFMGQMMGRQMLESLNMSDPASMRVLSINPGALSQQINRSQDFTQALGLNPSKIRAIADNWYLLENRATSAAQAIKLRVAEEALPTLGKWLDRGLAVVERNAGRIGPAIETAFNWLFVEFPPMVLTSSAAAMRGLGALGGALGGFSEGLLANLPGIVGGIDSVLNALRELGGYAYGVAHPSKA